MPDGKTLKLTKPLTTHEGDIAVLEFVEPGYREYSELGEVTDFQATRDGQVLHLYREATIMEYAKKCVRPKGHEQYFPQLNLHDTRGMRDVILGFFRASNQEEEASETSQKNSGSTAEQTPKPSTA